MPTSSGADIIPGSVGSLGGGSGSSVCSITPSDEQGQIDSLTARVKALEDIVSQLVGVNVNAGELSELSQQVGWLGGVSYMGQPGWTQTEYGTLIPPPGFSLVGSQFKLSDGNSYTGVSVDSDGVIQFGFLANGTPTGQTVTTWDNGGIQHIAARTNSPRYTLTSGNSTSPGDLALNTGLWNFDATHTDGIGLDGYFDVSDGTSIKVLQAGIYLVSCAMDITYTGTFSSGSVISYGYFLSGSGETNNVDADIFRPSSSFGSNQAQFTTLIPIKMTGTHNLNVYVANQSSLSINIAFNMKVQFITPLP